MAKFSRLKSDEQELIKFTPIWVFLLVSKVDGKMDEKEYNQFKKDLKELSTSLPGDLAVSNMDSGIIHEIFSSVLQDFEKLSVQVGKYPLPPMEGVRKVGILLDTIFNKPEADLFRNVLMSIATNVADSSGSRWSFLGRNISKVEMLIINDIKTALRYF
jgi:hypothetical protein